MQARPPSRVGSKERLPRVESGERLALFPPAPPLGRSGSGAESTASSDIDAEERERRRAEAEAAAHAAQRAAADALLQETRRPLEAAAPSLPQQLPGGEVAAGASAAPPAATGANLQPTGL